MALTRIDFIDDAAQIGCEVEAIMAVMAVESQGGGFNPDGTPKTLFEGHYFSRLTKGVYDKSHPTISYPKWTRAFYGKTWQAEQLRLNQAIALNKDAALQSASWGMFQIMGANFGECGFKTAQQFVEAMCTDENAQLAAFTQYIIKRGLTDELRDKRWADFAKAYNGPGYATNQYDTKLAAAYKKAKGL